MSSFPHSQHCEYFQASIELIGRRWTAAILRTLFAGCNRFTEIAEAIPGLSHRLLAERLNELLQAGLVLASDEIRPLYSLSERGLDLRPALAELEAWNHRWLPSSQATRPTRSD